MMIVPTDGRRLMLGVLVGQVPISTLSLHLYTNNKTPADNDTVGDYAEVPAGYGYVGVPLSPGDWTIGTDEAAYPELTFSFLGAVGNVYGYYITHAGDGKLLWAERFKDGPYNIANNGDQIKIAPRLALA